MKQRMQDRSFLAAVFMIALPIAMQNLLGTTAGMVDTIMIGSEGELSVAAVGICSQITTLFYSFSLGFAGGMVLFFTQYWGARDEDGINRTFGASLMFVLAVALPFAAIVITMPEFMLRIYTDKEHIVALAVPYIRIVGFSYPVQVVAVILSFLLRSTERIKATLISSVTALLVNFTLNWILIYGRFGMPKMGAKGAAVGTLVSTAVNLTLLLIFLLTSKCEIRLRLDKIFRWEGGFLKEFLYKCFPVLCNEVFYGIGQMIINIVIGHQSEPAIAAMATFRVLEGFVFSFYGGLADASSVVVGKEVGAGHLMRGYQYTKKFAVLCPVITGSICLILILVNEPLLALFGLGPEAMLYGKYMLMIYLAAGTLRTSNYIMNVSFRAGGETVFGSILEVGGILLLSVPAVWISGMIVKLPFIVVFAFIYSDEILRLVVEIYYVRSGKWVKPVTASGIAALPAFREELSALRKHRKKAV